METEKEGNQRIFLDLKKWVEQAGGKINSSIELRGQSTRDGSKGDGIRGLFATKTIKKGELLLRIPGELAISGEKLPRKWKDRVASPWLRCLACLYLAQDDEKWKPYISSLPSEYETLWQWKDEEMTYLNGTALGETLKADREEGALESRIKDYVLPYMKYLKIPSATDGKDALQVFKQVSMCISTRGFHMQPPESDVDAAGELDKKPAAKGKTSYVGPFLLPVIDLLNHSDTNKATTLQRDQDTGAFCMIAERDLEEGEELLHSYGDLTASQLLQTFGFIPEQTIRSSIGEALSAETRTMTPAMLSKEELVNACQSVKKSSYPKELTETMKKYEIEGDAFDLDDTKDRDLSFLPDQLLISSSATSSCLNDEIVTLCCTQLLPNEVYGEIFEDEQKQLLDQSVLEDYFLGKLVAMAILTAIKKKLATYKPLATVPCVQVDETDDKALLQQLLKLDNRDVSTLRAMYGITVRLEEKKGLEELRNEVIAVISSLDEEEEGDDDNEDDMKARPTKRVKADE